MVKTLISTLIACALIVAGSLFEGDFVQRQFQELNDVLVVLYEKVENETATEADVLAMQDNWHDKKRFLHAFIPHNEIKEFDLWIGEAIIFVKNKEWSDALSKIQVLLDLSTQVPKTFIVSFDNIL